MQRSRSLERQGGDRRGVSEHRDGPTVAASQSAATARPSRRSYLPTEHSGAKQDYRMLIQCCCIFFKVRCKAGSAVRCARNRKCCSISRRCWQVFPGRHAGPARSTFVWAGVCLRRAGSRAVVCAVQADGHSARTKRGRGSRGTTATSSRWQSRVGYTSCDRACQSCCRSIVAEACLSSSSDTPVSDAGF